MSLLDSFVVRALLAGLGVALAAAPLGCFVVWRRMAYFSDATAHAAILGVALALALSVNVFLGVLAVAGIMALAVSTLTSRGHAMDTLLGVAAHSALAAGLAANSSLRELRLAGNRFGADGFAALAEAVGSSGVRDIGVGDRGRPEEEGEMERAGRNALRRALGPRRAPASPEPVVEPQPLPESPLLQRAARSHGLLSTVF